MKIMKIVNKEKVRPGSKGSRGPCSGVGGMSSPRSLNLRVYNKNVGGSAKSWIRKSTNTASVRYFDAAFVRTPCGYKSLEY